ncbi:hypothetical protein ACFLU2_00485 [Chloroflexota bacterium]
MIRVKKRYLLFPMLVVTMLQEDGKRKLTLEINGIHRVTWKIDSI